MWGRVDAGRSGATGAFPSATEATASPSPTGYSDMCRLAGLDWVSAATKASTGLVLGVSSNDLSDRLSDDVNKMTVGCGTGMLTNTAAKANFTLSLINMSVTASGAASSGRHQSHTGHHAGLPSPHRELLDDGLDHLDASAQAVVALQPSL